MHILIVANGSLDLSRIALDGFADPDLVIAADGGANHCIKKGIKPDILIGDMDSVEKDVLDAFKEQGVEFHRYPCRKDATDLELALNLAKEKGATHISLLGGLGGRWDMSLSNILLAAGDAYRDLKISIIDKNSRISILHSGVDNLIPGKPGETCSFLPLRGDVVGITLTGFEYPLYDEILLFGSSRGLSNILLREEGIVRLKQGILLCMQQSK